MPSSAVGEHSAIDAIDLILASASPRRADLLAEAGYMFRIQPMQIDEAAARSGVADGDTVAATTAIARAKFAAFAASGVSGNSGSADSSVLTADTLVACRGVTMGKPDSAGAVAEMLAHMSGQRLSITTAVCFGSPGEQPREATVSTTVQLIALTAAQISRYAEANVGLDKAAGLALQAQARPFIASMDRCWSNVLGLPLCAVHALTSDSSEATQHSVSRFCVPARCGSHLQS